MQRVAGMPGTITIRQSRNACICNLHEGKMKNWKGTIEGMGNQRFHSRHIIGT